jgi:hypothetical protein
MSGPGLTTNPRTGQVFRLQPPKQRSAQYRALVAAIEAAKQAQGAYMRENNLAFDGQARQTVRMPGRTPLENGAIKTELERLLAVTRAAQQAAKAYKTAHREEFMAEVPSRGAIPTINVPRGRRPN